MKFEKPLLEGRLLQRYKRFFADIQWKDQKITAHVPNTGRMLTCSTPGSLCRFSQSADPHRKLPFTLEMVQGDSGAWIGVNTSWPNKLMLEALKSRQFSRWKNFENIQSEAKITAETRFDFLLSSGDQKHYIEVKNVTWAEGETAFFPDAVSTRGQKHLRELIRMKNEGHGAEIVYIVQRNDVKKFSPAEALDRDYAELFYQAAEAGVEISVLQTEVSDDEVKLVESSVQIQKKELVKTSSFDHF